MRQYLLRVAVALFLVPAAVVTAADRQTFLTIVPQASHDSINVLGTMMLADSDTDSGLTLLVSPSAAIHGMYFLVEGDSIKAPFERIGGDTIIVARPCMPAFSLSRVLSFNLAFPIDKSSDSLIMLDRGNRWYPVLPHGLTFAKITVITSGDWEVFSTGDATIRESRGTVVHQFTSKIPVYKIPLVIARGGNYRLCVRNVAGHEISLIHFSLADSTARQVVAKAASAFEYYQDLLGDFHHQRLTILEVPGFEGTNIGTGILMIGTPTMEAIAAGQSEPLTLTIASQWFGAGVFCEFSNKGFWFMTLSFSHYLRMLYEGRTLDSAGFAAKIDDNLAVYRKIAGSAADTPIIDIVRPDSREKGMVIYSKGPWLVYQLQACLGEGNLQRVLKRMYLNSLGKVLSIEGLMLEIAAQDKECARKLEDALQATGL